MVTDHKKRAAEYMRKYRQEHPDYEPRNRLACAVRLLTRNGYTVIAPEPGTDGHREEVTLDE